MALNEKSRHTAMISTYGYGGKGTCATCCNMKAAAGQKSFSFCIAYGEGYPWNPSALSCGLYGRPFNDLVPKYRQMCELKEPQDNNADGDFEVQLSLF